MSLLDVRLHPDPVLRVPAVPVTEITPDVLRLLDDMLETMYEEVGIGLAAPQVGVSQRLIVIDIHAGRLDVPRWPLKMINPEIVTASVELSSYDEGCLSIPQMNGEVWRPAIITVRYLDTAGKTQEIKDATGLLATCIQHEIDHLDGTLFIDHLTPLKRNMLLRRYQKRQDKNSDEA